MAAVKASHGLLQESWLSLKLARNFCFSSVYLCVPVIRLAGRAKGFGSLESSTQVAQQALVDDVRRKARQFPTTSARILGAEHRLGIPVQADRALYSMK